MGKAAPPTRTAVEAWVGLKAPVKCMGVYTRIRVAVQDLAPKHYVTPDGQRSFIRTESAKPRKSKFISGRKPWSYGKVIQVLNFRQSAVERLISGRHNGPCDTDDGEIYYTALVRIHVMRWAAMTDDDRNPKPLNTHAWAQKHTPKLAAEHPKAWFIAQEDAILAELAAKPATVQSAEAFAQDLRITHAEVIAFKLKSVGAIDRDRRQQAIDKRQADAKRRRKEREKAGDVIPHSASMAQTKPWLALDPPISRATYYRKVEKGELPKDPNMRRLRPKKRA